MTDWAQDYQARHMRAAEARRAAAPPRREGAGGDYPGYGFATVDLTLDSAARNEAVSDPARGLYSFVLTSGSSATQAVGLASPLRDVVRLELAAFAMPLPPAQAYPVSAAATEALPLLTPNPGTPGSATLGALSQLPLGRISLEIAELAAQASRDLDGRRPAFEFTCAVQGDRLQLTPLRSSFVLNHPLASLENLTLRFGNPTGTVSFPPDLLSALQATSATAPPNLDLQLPAGHQAHNLVADDRVSISRANTGNAVIDRYLMREEGLLVGAGTTATYIRLNPDVDTTVLGIPPFGGATMRAVVQKNRFRIPLRVTCLTKQPTNWLYDQY